MYFYVLVVMWLMGLYLVMVVVVFVGVVWQIKMVDLVIVVLVLVGVVCILVVLVSGVVWGKLMWGIWWIWDVCLILELVLLFLYVGVIVLWYVFDDCWLVGCVVGIFVLVGVVNLFIIYYLVYWWNILYQGLINLQ